MTLEGQLGLLLILGEARGRELARESGESVDMNVSGLTLSRASSLPQGLHQAVGTSAAGSTLVQGLGASLQNRLEQIAEDGAEA
ncbi:hypothetical protein BWR59_30435 [Pseudomonas sp. Bc-h]|nr:hypothetical protein BWR59_30435 [Pseudomonas sp. Bc-h]